MQSHVNKNKDTAIKTVWLLIAVALNALELFIPRIPFLPWLKVGLANSITILWIIRFGVKDALLYTVLRSWISSFYFGFSFLTIVLSLSGGIFATFMMGMAWKILGRRGMLGTIGTGIIGAFFHNAGQLIAVYFVLTRNESIFYQIPFMVLASLVFGGIVGGIVPVLWRILNNSGIPQIADISTPLQKYTAKHVAASLTVLIFCISLFSVSDYTILFIIAAAVSIVVSIVKRNFKTFLYPLKFWPIFFFILFIYLGFSYGKSIEFIPFLTYEGVNIAFSQILRVWTWVMCGVMLKRFRFNEIVYSFLKKIYPSHTETLISGILALEYFPEVVGYAKSKECLRGLNVLKKPFCSFKTFTARIQTYIISSLSPEIEQS